MSFLNPLFLIALLAAAIPLLIYWLNVRKPKKVRFSTLAFFDSLKQTALKRLKFKRILLLLIRMSAILMLVFAAAKPFMPGGFGLAGTNEPKAIAILVDNSPSMDQVDRNGPYFDQAKEAAEQILELANSDDRILLNVTNGESLNLPFLQPGNAPGRISALNVENKGNFLPDRLKSMIDRLISAEEPNKWLYVITDGQETQLRQMFEEEYSDQENIQVSFITLGEALPVNVGIENVDLETAEDDEIRLRVTLRNYGDETAQNRFINFILSDELTSQQAFELEGGESREFQFSVPTGDMESIEAQFVIEGDELTFDDSYFAAIQLPQVRKIAVIRNESEQSGFQSYLLPMMEVMAEEQSRFDVDFFTPDQVSPDDLFGSDAIILDGIRSIPDYLSQAVLDVVQDGGGALLIPAADGEISNYNRLLRGSNSGLYSNVNGSYGSFEVIDRMAEPTDGHPVLDKIFDVADGEEIQLNVPEIFYMYQIEQASGSGTFPLLETRSGRPLVQESRIGNGRMIYSAVGSDPGWSNFPVKPFFAPFFYRAVEYLSSGEGAELNIHNLGSPFELTLDQFVEVAEIEKESESVLADITQRFEGTRIYYEGKEWSPGFGKITTENEERLFSVNQNAMESELNSLEYAELNEKLSTLFDNVRTVDVNTISDELITELQSASLGREIWFWFIIAAIILLMSESVISRFYNVESIS